jgi:hypothetical protein
MEKSWFRYSLRLFLTSIVSAGLLVLIWLPASRPAYGLAVDLRSNLQSNYGVVSIGGRMGSLSLSILGNILQVPLQIFEEQVVPIALTNGPSGSSVPNISNQSRQTPTPSPQPDESGSEEEIPGTVETDLPTGSGDYFLITTTVGNDEPVRVVPTVVDDRTTPAQPRDQEQVSQDWPGNGLHLGWQNEHSGRFNSRDGGLDSEDQERRAADEERNAADIDCPERNERCSSDEPKIKVEQKESNQPEHLRANSNPGSARSERASEPSVRSGSRREKNRNERAQNFTNGPNSRAEMKKPKKTK